MIKLFLILIYENFFFHLYLKFNMLKQNHEKHNHQDNISHYLHYFVLFD